MRTFKHIVIVMLLMAFLPAVGAEMEKELVTGLTGKFPPFSYYDQKGELAGFDVDVTREIAARLGRKPRIIAIEWDGILAGLLAGKYDAIIGSMAVTPEREKQVRFSSPYYKSGAQIFVHRDNPDKIYSINDCAGLRTGVVLGETYQRYLENHHPEIETLTFKSTAEMFEMLEQHRLSAFVTDRLVGLWQIKQAKRPFVPVGQLLYSESIGIPVRRSEKTLCKEIDHALAQMKADGTMKKLFSRYFGASRDISSESGAMSPETKACKLLKGFGITLIIALFSVIIGFILAIPAGILLATQNKKYKPALIAMRLFIDFIRGTPVLIQLLFVWLGLGFRPFPAAIMTLGICTMAYMAESIRAGLMSVDPGQNLAAQALGLGIPDRFRFIIWPQAFRIALPSLMNSTVALIKDTALVSVITIPELIREAQSIISVTFEPGKYYLIAALMFFAVTFPLMKLAGRIEKHIEKKGFHND